MALILSVKALTVAGLQQTQKLPLGHAKPYHSLGGLVLQCQLLCLCSMSCSVCICPIGIGPQILHLQRVKSHACMHASQSVSRKTWCISCHQPRKVEADVVLGPVGTGSTVWRNAHSPFALSPSGCTCQKHQQQWVLKHDKQDCAT